MKDVPRYPGIFAWLALLIFAILFFRLAQGALTDISFRDPVFLLLALPALAAAVYAWRGGRARPRGRPGRERRSCCCRCCCGSWPRCFS
ncbi:MAG: hypothetical protein RDU13_06055 [Elusimicrobiales bacterium]|nr:hypothetical protein [Elusimicrobiales bacterium]